MGRDWFDTVWGVGLHASNGASDEEIAAALDGVRETRSLQLDRSKASYATVEAIGRMASLEHLMMFNTAVDDRCLPLLYELKSLTRLDVRKTRVTASGVEKLREALPGAVISADWP